MINFAGLSTPIFAFYLLVLCNFVPHVIGCRLQTLLQNSMLAKHIVGYILLVFLVVLVNPENADREIVQTLIVSLALYVWFLMTTRTPFMIMLIIIILLSIAYLLNTTRERAQKEDKPELVANIKRTQFILTVVSLGLTLIGFVVYYIEKKREYKSKFSAFSFIFGNTKCRGYTPDRAMLI